MIRSKTDDINAAMVSAAILGTYEGECADADITNKNGLDITREVWEAVFNSTEYAEAIERGWYIGFLGHPEDPGCQDFEHACIVMTSGRIEDNGKIYGTFNLVDTPVGRIVKAFQDAGVQFGISVRGAGDIVGMSVDPDTFVFRGFDLVAFPAYPEAIPTFTAIAASSDPVKQQQYKNVCDTVKANIDQIDNKETLDIIKQNFAPQSDVYKILADKEVEMDTPVEEADVEVLKNKVTAMTDLYVNETKSVASLNKQISSLRQELSHVRSTELRKIKSMRRILATQLKNIKADNEVKLDNISKNNLIYKQRVKSARQTIKNQETEISGLKSRLRETVTAMTELQSKTSDMDAKNQKLLKKIESCENLISEYQDAYASLYCTAVGAMPKSVKVTASTSVGELEKMMSVKSATNTSNVFVQPAMLDLTDIESQDEEEIVSL